VRARRRRLAAYERTGLLFTKPSYNDGSMFVSKLYNSFTGKLVAGATFVVTAWSPVARLGSELASMQFGRSTVWRISIRNPGFKAAYDFRRASASALIESVPCDSSVGSSTSTVSP
jgi:hypothetical protein